MEAKYEVTKKVDDKTNQINPMELGLIARFKEFQDMQSWTLKAQPACIAIVRAKIYLGVIYSRTPLDDGKCGYFFSGYNILDGRKFDDREFLEHQHVEDFDKFLFFL